MKIGEFPKKVGEIKIDKRKDAKVNLQSEFNIGVEDLDKREISMCACSASDDNPYQQSV